MLTGTKPALMIDVDGVIIIGRHQDGANWATDLQRDLGVDKSALQDHFFRPFWADIVTGKDDLLTRLQQALANMKSHIKASDLRDYWFANDAAKNAPMLDWIEQKRTTGHRIMLATNQDHSRADYLMNTLDLRAHCDGIYYSAAIGAAKPDPLFFKHISENEGLPPADLMLIDDTARNVAAAQSAGWQTHHFTGMDQLTTAWVSGD